MKKMFCCIIILLLICFTCIKLDFFLWEGEEADSIEGDYHGLPLYVGDNPPSWIGSSQIEKEIYLSVPGGELIAPDQLSGHNNYIHGVFMPAPGSCPSDSCPLIDESVTFLYLHGNSGTMFRYWYRAVALWNMGANVFIITYRGYGLSRGETSRKNIKKDAEVAATYLKSRHDIDTSKIVVYGYSMGGITASYLAGASSHKNSFAGVILESAMDSPEEVVDLSMGTDFPGGFFLDDEPYDGTKFIKKTTIPVLHIHGGEDERVIIDQAYNYYEVLKDHTDYTHYIGKTNKPHEEWIGIAAHRNMVFYPFVAGKHIADYWDDSKNPNNCCVHPDEYTEPQFAGFLKDIGNTNGAAMVEAARKYEDLVVDWVVGVIP